MAATYIPNPLYHPSIVKPSPGDAATAASVNTTALEFLADDAAYLFQFLQGQSFFPITASNAWDEIEPPIATGMNQPNSFQQVGQQVANRFERIRLAFPGLRGQVEWPQGGLVAAEATAFSFSSSAGLGGMKYVQTDTSTTGSLAIPLQVPNGGVFHSIFVSVRGDVSGGGIHSSLPGTMPSFSLIEQVNANAPATVVATVTDPSSTVAIYEAPHNVTLDLSSALPAVNPLAGYYLLVRGEAGANAQDDAFGVYNVRVKLAAADD